MQAHDVFLGSSFCDSPTDANDVSLAATSPLDLLYSGILHSYNYVHVYYSFNLVS